MRRHLILHIGLSKTGSTSIQHILAGRRDALREIGVYFMESPGWANHALLPASLVNDQSALLEFHAGVWEGMNPEARIARFRKEWAQEVASLPDWAERCLITAEQIGLMLFADDEVERLGAVLRPVFASVKVIVYLRRQDEHAASAYTQWLRGGTISEPGLPPGGPAEIPDYDYGAMLDRFARVFGDDAMCVRIYDPAEFEGGDAVTDFLTVAGLDLDISPDDPRRQSNPGITLEGQHLIVQTGLRLEAAAPGTPWRYMPAWRRFTESVGEALPGRGWQPTRDEARTFLARFAATNEHARRRFFPERETLFRMNFDQFPDTAHTVSAADVLEAAIDVLMHEMQVSTARESAAAMAQYRLFRKLGDEKGMRNMLVRAVKFGPDELPPRLRLAEFYLSGGDLRQAREHAAAALRIAPQDEAAQRVYARVERIAASAPRKVS